MENGRKDFVGTLCNIYMILLMTVLPLYHRGTYYQIGDSKYLFFRNVSWFCLGIWLVCMVVSAVSVGLKRMPKAGHALSGVDIAMLIYGGGVMLSALLSPYQETAWWGYREWYMGAVSQLILVGIYFFVSREYTGQAYPVYFGEVALLAVCIIGFLQRFDVDVFGLQAPFVSTDWEYSHMLSTVGNINWLCGYLSVMLPLPVVGYLYSRRRGKTAVCYLISVFVLTMTLTQGSEIGILSVLLCLGLGFLNGVYGMKREQFCERSILMAVGVCVLCPAIGLIMERLGTLDRVAADGILYSIMTKPFWWGTAAILLLYYILLRRLPGRTARLFNQVGLIGSAIFAVVIVCICLWWIPYGSSWGNGRDGLWRAAWQAFCNMSLSEKLLGVGPDCFAEYIYRNPALAELIVQSGHWEGAIFANAHNEWLNILVNGGILGVATYAGVFICGLKRYRGMLLGIMVLCLYGAGSLFGFQQVVSTPLFFLILGICENRYRKKETQEFI